MTDQFFRLSFTVILLAAIPVNAADKPKPPPPALKPEPLTIRQGEPLSPRALVARPAILKNVAGWSLETRRHRGNFQCFALSPDGKQLATGGLDGTIRIWQADTGKLLRALIGHGSYVYGLDWSPDGTMLASGGSFDGTVRVWDARSGHPLRVLKGHPAYVVQVAWSPDGRSILGAGGASGIVSHWDVASGKHEGKIEMGRPVLSISWNPDNRGVAVVAQALPLQLCNVNSYKVDKTLGDAKTVFTYAAWSPDGKTLAAGTSSGTHLYDAEGTVKRTLEGAAAALAWDREGKQLAVSMTSSATIRVWEAASGNVVKALSGLAYILTFHPEGKRIVGADYTSFTNYNIEAGKAETSFSIAGTQPPIWTSGRMIVTGIGTMKISLWEPASGKFQRTLEGHTSTIAAAAWAPDGKTLATCGYDKTVRLWDPTNGKALFTFTGHTGPVLAIAFAPDNKSIASAGSDKKVLVWKVPTGEIQRTFEGHTAEVNCLAWGSTASGLLASGSNDKTARTWNVKTGQAGKEFTETGETAILSLAWSPDSKTLASGHYDHRVRLWQAATGKLLNTMEEPGSPPQVSSLAWPSNNQVIASGRGNHTLQIWNPKNGQRVHSMPTMAPVQKVGFSSGLGTVVACNADRTARFFDVATGALRGVMLAEDNQIILISAEGHFRADNAAQELIVVVQLEKSQETFTPAAFTTKFHMTNSPSTIRLTPK